MGELAFSYSDLYPAMGGIDTSTLAQPDPDDQDALNEDRTAAEQADAKAPTTKRVLAAVLVVLCLAVFFGGAK